MAGMFGALGRVSSVLVFTLLRLNEILAHPLHSFSKGIFWSTIQCPTPYNATRATVLAMY